MSLKIHLHPINAVICPSLTYCNVHALFLLFQQSQQIKVPLNIHRDTTNFQYFDINTSDIWKYEWNCYNGEKENHILYYHNYDDLKQFLLKNDIQPFLSPETVKSGKNGQHYYDNYKFERLPKRDYGYALDFFEHNGCFYSFLSPFIINRENCSDLEFQKYFSMKLKQYKDGLTYIHQFLYYQLNKSFKTDQSNFFQFLKLLLLQYEDSLTPQVIHVVDRFISNPQILLSLQKKERTGFDNFPDIPTGYRIIPGVLNREETLQFFSFLFLEKSKTTNRSYLKKKPMIFLNLVLLYPPLLYQFPSYNLNCSKRFPKSITIQDKSAIFRLVKCNML